MFRSLFLPIILLSILTFSACQRAEQKTTASTDVKRFDLTGKVVEVDAKARKLKIDHEAIKDQDPNKIYMPAMTMNFPIREKDAWIFNEVKPGNKIGGAMVLEPNGDYWLEEIALSAAPNDFTDVTEPARLSSNSNVGREIVDFELTNQDGKRITAKDFRGKTLVMTFIFTRCPDREFCPMMSLNMSDLEKIVRQNPELKDRVKLLSVTFDPEYDTPEVLRKYGAGYLGNAEQPNFDIWQLATGTAAQVSRVSEFFGIKTSKKGERVVHNLSTAVIARDGKVLKIYAGNDWKPADILKDLQTPAASK